MGQLTALRLFNAALNGTISSATLTTQLATRAGEWANLFEDPAIVSKLFTSTTALGIVGGSSAAVTAMSKSLAVAKRLFDGTQEANTARLYIKTPVAALKSLTDLVASTLGVSNNFIPIATSNTGAPSFIVPDNQLVEDTVNNILYSTSAATVSRSLDFGVNWKVSNDSSLGGVASQIGTATLLANLDSGMNASICSDGTFMYGLVTSTQSLSNRALIKITDHGTWVIHCQLPLYNGVTPVNWTSVTYGGGKFLIAGQAGSNVYTANSADGITWTYATLPTVTTNVVHRVKYVNGRFFVLMSAGVLSHCTDAVTWVNANYNGTDTLANCRAYDITYATDTYALMGDTTTTSYRAWYSTNLTSYTSVVPAAPGGTVPAVARVQGMEAIGDYIAVAVAYNDGTNNRTCILRSTNKGVSYTASHNVTACSGADVSLTTLGSNFVLGWFPGTAGAYTNVSTQASATGTMTHYAYIGRQAGPYAAVKNGSNVYLFSTGYLYSGWYFDGTDVYSTDISTAAQYTNTTGTTSKTVGLAYTTLVCISTGSSGAGVANYSFRHDSVSYGIYWKYVGNCTGTYMTAGDTTVSKLTCSRSGVAGSRDMFIMHIFNSAATTHYIGWSTNGLAWTNLVNMRTDGQATQLILKYDGPRTLADGTYLKGRFIYAHYNSVSTNGAAGIIEDTQTGNPIQTGFSLSGFGTASYVRSMFACDDGSILAVGSGTTPTQYIVSFKARSVSPTALFSGWTSAGSQHIFRIGDIVTINIGSRYRGNVADDSPTLTIVPATKTTWPGATNVNDYDYPVKRLSNGSIVTFYNSPLALYRLL